jgi:hypothetical protein
MAIINSMNPERKRPSYYEDTLINPASKPQNIIPQYSQLNVTPEYGYSRIGSRGGMLMDRGSVTQSGYPESNPLSLGVPPSLLPRPQMDQIMNQNINRVVNQQKTTTLIMPPSLPQSQSVYPNPALIGSFGKKQKQKISSKGKKKKGFYGI